MLSGRYKKYGRSCEYSSITVLVFISKSVTGEGGAVTTNDKKIADKITI